MANANSYYLGLYESDAKHRSTQKLTDFKKAAKAIMDIMLKSQLNSRYKIAVPLAYSMITYFPDSLKEYFMKKR